MSKFHVGKNGPERCSASVRACPLGGEHFESMREAQVAAVQSDFMQSYSPLGRLTFHLEDAKECVREAEEELRFCLRVDEQDLEYELKMARERLVKAQQDMDEYVASLTPPVREFPLDLSECVSVVQEEVILGLSVTEVQDWLRVDHSKILGVLDQTLDDFRNGMPGVTAKRNSELRALGVVTVVGSNSRSVARDQPLFTCPPTPSGFIRAKDFFASRDRRTLLIAVGEDPDSFDWDDVELWSFAIHQQAHDLLPRGSTSL